MLIVYLLDRSYTVEKSPFGPGLIHQMLSELMPLDLIEFHQGLDRLCHGAALPPSNARRVGPDQQ